MREVVLKLLYEFRYKFPQGLTKKEIIDNLGNKKEGFENELKYLIEKQFIRKTVYSKFFYLYCITAKGVDVIETDNWQNNSVIINCDIITSIIGDNAKNVIVGKQIENYSKIFQLDDLIELIKNISDLTDSQKQNIIKYLT